MARAAKTAVRSKRDDVPLADRLLALFGFELGVLERAVAPLLAAVGEGEGEAIGVGEGSAPARDAAGAKGRIEAISQMTRTLEKLLELKQLEMLAFGGGAPAPDAEAERLAAELMRRLRVLDRRRRIDAGPAVAPDFATPA